MLKKIFPLIFILFAGLLIHPGCKEKDNNPPVITILGNNPLTHQLGEPYVDPGATAYDEEDGDITGKIETINFVDPNTQGYSYHVYYNVEDEAGNKATEAIRIVNVLQF